MDNTKEFTAVEFCAGYGGIHLGLKRIIPNLRLIAACEIEAFAIANLVAKMEAGLMDPAPIWPNLKTFPCEPFREKVDLLVAGYPCQPFSHAGKRRGKEDPRHLWPSIQRAIQSIRPRYCFFENVEGHLTLGFKDVCHDLDELGYIFTAGLFTAEEVSAPQPRERLFIMAHCISERGKARISEQDQRKKRKSGITNNKSYQAWPSYRGEPQYAWEPPRVVGDTPHDNRGTGECRKEAGTGQDGKRGRRFTVASERESKVVGNTTDSRCQTQQGDRKIQAKASGEVAISKSFSPKSNRQTQSPLGRSPDGHPSGMDYAELCVSCDNRTDELRLLGNGVVPAVAAKAWQVLYDEISK